MKRISIVMLLAILTGIARGDDLSDANEYFLSGQYQKAITSYERALDSVSDKAQTYYNLGVCHERLGNLERAISYYQRAGNVKDAPQAVVRLERQVKERKIARLRDEAQRAYDAMNYGVARGKAQEILKLDPSNTWAGSFLARLDTERVTDTLSVPAETLSEPPPETLTATPTQDTLAVSEKRLIPFGFWLAGAILAAAAGLLGFALGRLGRRDTLEKTIRALVQLLPAGMLSVRRNDKLGLLFFEKGRVIRALVEEDEGMIIEGKEVAEELAGKKCPYSDKGDGPWSRFADSLLAAYHETQEKARSRKRSSSK